MHQPRDLQGARVGGAIGSIVLAVVACYHGFTVLAGCGDALPTDVGSSSASTARSPSSVAREASEAVQTPSSVASASGAASSPSITPSAVPLALAKPIATWLGEASVKVADSRDKPVAFEGVYRRTSLYQSGVYVGGEHPGIRVIVLHVADSLEAPPNETLQCWTDLLAAPSDLHAGDRLRIEGSVSHLVLTGRQYLAYVGKCRFARK